MKLYFEKEIILGFLILLAMLTWLSLYFYNYNKKFVATSLLVTHTNNVLFHAERLLTMLKDMEANQRGYIITGDSTFLKSLSSAEDTVFTRLQELQLLTRDNIRQQKRLQKLRSVSTDKMQILKSIITARKSSFDEARRKIMTGKSRFLMEQINIIVSDIQGEERVLLKKRIADREKNYEKFTYSFAIFLVGMALILVVIFIVIYLNVRNRRLAHKALSKTSADLADLYENSPCGYYSLNKDGIFVEVNLTLLTWLRYSYDEVVGKLSLTDVVSPETRTTFLENFQFFKEQGYIHDLEFDFVRKDSTVFHGMVSATAIYNNDGDYVKSRSTVFDITDRKKAELKSRELNHELEAFTYSVSHDLRSPLRSINGYAKIFVEDYCDKVDVEGLRVLNVIMSNATKMGNLIDDLLDFSRVGKKEIIKFPYNVEHMVRSLVSELMEHEKQRQVNINVLNLASSLGDAMLIRQVWLNLISNALKYTQKTTSVQIEIGSMQENDHVVYYVKDNGVGFDMKYVGKLFGVFQRLHQVKDFEGTGVGLAIVQRIVKRHGGNVWAVGSVNEGATFFFSLPLAS